MPRYVDADKIADFVCSICGQEDCDRSTEHCIEREFTERCAEEMPTVDAVEVVRCKDCKYAHMTYGGECKYCDCWKDEDDRYITLYLDGDFHCAFGERREDAKTN